MLGLSSWSTQWVYSVRLVVVSARTSKSHQGWVREAKVESCHCHTKTVTTSTKGLQEWWSSFLCSHWPVAFPSFTLAMIQSVYSKGTAAIEGALGVVCWYSISWYSITLSVCWYSITLSHRVLLKIFTLFLALEGKRFGAIEQKEGFSIILLPVQLPRPGSSLASFGSRLNLRCARSPL